MLSIRKVHLSHGSCFWTRGRSAEPRGVHFVEKHRRERSTCAPYLCIPQVITQPQPIILFHVNVYLYTCIKWEVWKANDRLLSASCSSSRKKSFPSPSPIARNGSEKVSWAGLHGTEVRNQEPESQKKQTTVLCFYLCDDDDDVVNIDSDVIVRFVCCSDRF